MMKLKTLIKYEMWTSIKPVCIYYVIVYTIFSALCFIASLVNGNGYLTMSGVETSGFIYLGILGLLGFQEDFKILIQNGFSRKYIWYAALSMFVIISFLMALIDTTMASLLSRMVDFKSLFQIIYGHDFSFFIQWAWLFIVNLSVAFISYMAALLCNHIGAKKFWYSMLILFVVIVLMGIPFLIYILPTNALKAITTFISMLYGFSESGSIHIITPLLVGIGIVGVISSMQFKLIKKTELK